MGRPKRDAITIVLDAQAAYRRAYEALDEVGRRVVDELTKRQAPQPAKVQRTRRKVHAEPASQPQPEKDEAGARRIAVLTQELNDRSGHDGQFSKSALDRLYAREDLRPLIEELRAAVAAKKAQSCA